MLYEVITHSLSLYNYYRPRIDLGGDFFLIGIEESSLSIQFFQGHNLGFHRSREVEPNPHSIFQELLRTLVSCTKSFPLSRRAAVFLHTSWPEAEPLVGATRLAQLDGLAHHVDDGQPALDFGCNSASQSTSCPGSAPGRNNFV